VSHTDSEPRPPGMCLADIRRYLGADGKSPERVAALLQAHGIDDGAGRSDALVPIDVCWRIFTEHAALIDDEMQSTTRCTVRSGHG